MRQINTLNICVTALLFLLILSTNSAAHYLYFGAKPLVFGVAPQGEIHSIQSKWEPLIQHIAKKSRLVVRFETASNMEEFEARLAKGYYDLVYIDAYLYTLYHDKAGYSAFAKQKNDLATGVIVVHKDSQFNSLQDLNSQDLALPENRSFSGSLLTTTQLKQKGISVIPEYLGSDQSSFRAVAAGDVTAGAGELKNLNYINPIAHDKLRVLWRSKQYSSNAVAAHPRIKPEVLGRIQDAFLELNDSYEGMRYLSNIKFKGIAAAQDSEWDDVRALNLD